MEKPVTLSLFPWRWKAPCKEEHMTWVYDVKKKTFAQNNVYKFSARYAGAPGYKNDPNVECIVNKGPLPRGKYRISRPITKHPTAGRFVLRLTPYPENNMCGRDGFLIHGDNNKGTASKGCIILDLEFRRIIAESDDRELIVL